MSKLYSLKDQYLSVEDDINSSDEISEEQLMTIESIKDDINQKSINIGYLIKNLECDVSAIDDAVKNMQERQSKLMKKIEYLKQYLKYNLESCQIKEINSPYFDIRIRINPPSVKIEDEGLVPDQYFNEKIIKNIDKRRISDDLKNNIFVPGVTFTQATRLEIK